jgi:hypothetical protein
MLSLKPIINIRFGINSMSGKRPGQLFPHPKSVFMPNLLTVPFQISGGFGKVCFGGISN